MILSRNNGILAVQCTEAGFDKHMWPKQNRKYGPCTSLLVLSKIIGDTTSVSIQHILLLK